MCSNTLARFFACVCVFLVVRYNINLKSFCGPRKYHQLVATLLESIDIRGSIRGDAQIMSYSTLRLFPGFVHGKISGLSA